MKLKEQDCRALTAWYQTNKRSLPWRDTGNPYHVWVSEIMLQQTRIEAVIRKYITFMEELPDVRSLAECDDDRLMRLWEGLGYYSRARNLKKCAVVLMQQYLGILPADYNALRKLPGIGPYTAGAIASICYDLPSAAVDGNVLRVLARLFRYEEDIRDPKAAACFAGIIEQAFADGISPSLFNQAIMELGETVCLPNGVPHCEACPLSKSCLALQEHRLDSIPYRSKNNARKVRERTLLVIRDGERFVVRKRPDRGLLAGMYEFIGIERHLTKSEAVQEAEQLGFEVMHVNVLPEGVHIFTHLEWHMKAYELQVSSLHEYPSFTREELQERAFPSAFKTWIDWYALRQ